MSKIDNFLYITPIPVQMWGCFLWNRYVMLRCAKRGKVMLYRSSKMSNLYKTTIPKRYRQTDGRTDRQLAVAIPRSVSCDTRKPSWRQGYARKCRHSKMAVSRHLGFYRTANSTIRSADPENPSLEPNMECIGGTVCEIFAFKLYCNLETWVRGHSRSSKMAIFDRTHTTLYSSSIVTMPLSSTVSEI